MEKSLSIEDGNLEFIQPHKYFVYINPFKFHNLIVFIEQDDIVIILSNDKNNNIAHHYFININDSIEYYIYKSANGKLVKYE